MADHDTDSAWDREQLLQTLWGDPIAGVLGHDLPIRLQRGEEYLDLQHLELGVQRACGIMSPTGGELSRKAVRPATWDKLLVQLLSRGDAHDPRLPLLASARRQAGVPPPLPRPERG